MPEPGVPRPVTDSVTFDDPAAGSTASDAVRIRGWARAGDTPVLPVVEAGGTRLPAALWFERRDDVADAFGEDLGRLHGFAGWVDLAGLPAGSVDLVLRAGTATQALTLTHQTTSTRCAIEHPADGVCVDRLALSGWAHSAQGGPLTIRVESAAASVAAMTGLPRPDVAALAGSLPVACGWMIDAPVPDGVAPGGDGPLALLVEDADGRLAAHVLRIARSPATGPRIVLGTARRTGGRVEVRGVVTWPGPAPRDAVIVLAPDGGTACEASATDLRPEQLHARGGPACGFTVRAPDPAAGAPLRIALTARSDAGVATLTAHLPAAPDPRPPAGDALEPLTELAPAGATVLDVDGVLHAGGAARTFDLFAPPLPGVLPPLLPGSVDVVAIRARGGVVAEAVRSVARLGLLVDDDRGTVAARPAAPAVGVAPATRISALVPAYADPDLTDRCLAALLASRLPAGYELEVVAIDDECPENSHLLLAEWARRDARVRAETNPRNLGFLQTTNRAAKLATGDVLVMVNNDAFLQPDALAALCDALEEPRVGIAGGASLWPDGSLQEAGGAIFADGSAWHLGGASPNPDDPLFAARRPADYCSGALLALRRTTWDRLGGLDSAFDPGEYEDVDLCFRARAAGVGVWCVPQARAVHHMRSLWRRPSSHQERFAQRWAQTLAAYPERPATIDRVVQRGLIGDAAARCPSWPPVHA